MEKTISNKTLKIQLGVAITVVLFIIGTTSKITTSQTEISNRIEKLEIANANFLQATNENKQKIAEIEKDNAARDLQWVEVKTKLTGIEATLAEIKKELATHSRTAILE